MDVHELDQNLLETFLVECAKQFYIGEEFYISKDQRKIPDHFHWHARPTDPTVKGYKDAIK